MEKNKVRSCRCCGEQFTYQRSDKWTCSKRCSVMLSSWRSKRGLNKKKIREKGDLRECLNCKICKFKDNSFNKTGGVLHAWCKVCEKKARLLTIPKYDPIKTILEVNNYLQEMKLKSYWADIVDLYRLVDLFDKTHPHLENIPNSTDIKRSIDIMFYKLAMWWKEKTK